MQRAPALRAGRELARPVPLLGDVGQLEVLGERPGQRDGGAGVQAGEQPGDLGVAALVTGHRRPGQPAHLLHEVQQLGAAVVGQGLAEHGVEPPDVGAQRP